jgi:flagellar motor switch protein FliN/FliY
MDPDVLWWECPTELGAISVGSAENARRSIAGLILNSTPSVAAYLDPRQIYLNLLEQSSRRKGVVLDRAPYCPELVSLKLQVPGEPPVELILGLQESAPAAPAGALGALALVDLPVAVHFGSAEMHLHAAARLKPGAVVEFNRATGDPVELFVNGRLVAKGEAVVVNNNFGVRITEVMIGNQTDFTAEISRMTSQTKLSRRREQ